MKEGSSPEVVGRTELDVSCWVKWISKEVDFGSGENKIHHAFSQEDYVSILPMTLRSPVASFFRTLISKKSIFRNKK